MPATNSRRLNIEPLDQRVVPAFLALDPTGHILFSGNATTPGDVRILGDDNNDKVQVKVGMLGEIHVIDYGHYASFAADPSLIRSISFYGMGGDDWFKNESAINVYADGGDGYDTLIAGNGADNFLGGGNDDDSLVGGPGRDAMFGGYGQDTILGMGGIDHLYGDGGNDRIEGGNEGDYIQGNSGYDTLIGGEGNDTMDGGNQDDSLLGGIGDDSLRGGIGNDRLWGEGGVDMLIGGPMDPTNERDDDSLYGGTEFDWLAGGVGADYLDGGGDGITDLLIGNAGGDTFKTYATATGAIEDANAWFEPAEGDRLTGYVSTQVGGLLGTSKISTVRTRVDENMSFVDPVATIAIRDQQLAAEREAAAAEEQAAINEVIGAYTYYVDEGAMPEEMTEETSGESVEELIEEPTDEDSYWEPAPDGSDESVAELTEEPAEENADELAEFEGDEAAEAPVEDSMCEELLIDADEMIE